MVSDIGKFLQNVFNKDAKRQVIDLKALKDATQINERKSNAQSKALSEALDSFDTLSLDGTTPKQDGYLSGDTELNAFFSFVNKNRTKDANNEFLGDVLPNSVKREAALKDTFDLDLNEQIKAENYRLLNAILDPVNGDPARNLLDDDITKAKGTDKFLGVNDTPETLANLQTNNKIVITEDVAKERISVAAAEKLKQETAAAKDKEAIIDDNMAEAISKGSSGNETDPELETWLKTDANATMLKGKLGLTNGIASAITSGADEAAAKLKKDNLKLALNSLRELASMAIVKGTSGQPDKQPDSLEELLILKANEFVSPFYKIRRDAALTILLNLTELDLTKDENKSKIIDYKAFEGDEAINKATSLLGADSQQLNNYIYGNSGGPKAKWFTDNINSSKVTAEQIDNLAKINTVKNMADRGKAWAAFYATTQGDKIKNFAAQHLLQLDKVKDATKVITLEASEPEKAAKLVSMIGTDTVSFDGQNMIVKDKGGTTTKYTIPIKTSGSIIWDTSSDGSGAKAALEAIFKPTSSS